jgi:fructan beta-fructosidase
MVLAVKDHVEFYGSSNLIDWSKLSDFGLEEGSHDGVWECPDLIKVKIDGTKDQFKWVLIVSIGTGGERGSATQYFTGEFDGTSFVNENKQDIKWIDEGWDNYAGVTWFKETDQYEPSVFIGWMNNWEYAQIVPTEKWRGAMTIPRKLSLFTSNGDLFVRSYPVENLSYLRTDAIEVNRTLTNGVIDLSKNLQGKSSNEFDFELLISEVENPGSWEVVFSNTVGDTLKFGYNHIEKVYYTDRSGVNPFDFHQSFPKTHYGQRKSTSTQIPVRILLDRSSIEIFADLGEVTFTDQYFARRAFSHMQFTAISQPLLLEGMIYPMKSIWN